MLTWFLSMTTVVVAASYFFKPKIIICRAVCILCRLISALILQQKHMRKKMACQKNFIFLGSVPLLNVSHKIMTKITLEIMSYNRVIKNVNCWKSNDY